MTNRVLILTIVAALWLLPTSLWAGPPFSAENLARAMNARVDWVSVELQLGNYSLPDPAMSQDPELGIPRAATKAFVQHGLVTMAPNGFNQIIAPTQKGLAMARESGLPQRPGFLRVRTSTYEVTKYYGSDVLRSATGDWRYAVATFSRNPTPVGAAFDAHWGPTTRGRKGKMLLEYDRFTSQWVLKYFDAAKSDEELSTSYVDQAVAQLGLKRE